MDKNRVQAGFFPMAISFNLFFYWNYITCMFLYCKKYKIQQLLKKEKNWSEQKIWTILRKFQKTEESLSLKWIKD